MNPAWLFPLIALGFALAAVLRRRSRGAWRGAAATWLLLALMFGLVGLWLQRSS